jgi:hypothetical protein
MARGETQQLQQSHTRVRASGRGPVPIPVNVVDERILIGGA